MVSDELKAMLVANGLNKTQADSKTVQLVVDFLSTPDQKVLMANAEAVMRQANAIVDEMRRNQILLDSEIRHMKNEISSILEMMKAFSETGEITDEKAKNALALYTAIASVGTTEQASYIVYAYLGGEARQIIAPDFKDEKDNKKGVRR